MFRRLCSQRGGLRDSTLSLSFRGRCSASAQLHPPHPLPATQPFERRPAGNYWMCGQTHSNQYFQITVETRVTIVQLLIENINITIFLCENCIHLEITCLNIVKIRPDLVPLVEISSQISTALLGKRVVLVLLEMENWSGLQLSCELHEIYKSAIQSSRFSNACLAEFLSMSF